MLEWVRFILSAALMLCGLTILLTAVVGLYRFDDVLNRMHAAAMGDTLGLLSLTVSAPDLWTGMKLLLIILFMWLSSPVSSHLIARLEVTVNPRWHQLPPPDNQEEGERA